MDKHSYNKRKSEFVTRYEACKTYHDFRDLNTQVSDRTEKGDYFEIFSEAYFKTCHPASNNIKNYWPRHAIPSEVVELLRLSKEDKGTDFVIEHNDASFSLGQCKFVWDEDRTLAKKYLDSFIAETALVSPKVKIKNKHILTTASDVHDYIKQLQGLDVINNSNLNDTTEMENIIRYLRSEKPIYTYKDRHPLTKRVIKKAKKHFKKNDKGRLVIFCGGRKTLTSEDIVLEVLLNISGVLKKKFNKTARICFAAPSIALLTQTLNEWSKDLKARNVPYDFRVVCSDATAQNTESDDRSYGAFDLDEVKQWYNNKNKELKIVFTTFDSAENASQIGKFDFTIIDEAHQTATRVDSNKSFIVSDRFRSKKKMFQTATEKVINTENDEFFSMDDEKHYGKLIDNVTYSMLVKAGMIVPLELVLLSSDHWNELPVEERIEVEDNVYYRDGIKKNVPAKDLRSAYLLKKFMDSHKDETHYIYGCNSNPKARDIAEYLKHIMPNDVGVFNVDGEMTISKRQDVMGKFERSNRGIVTNCRCLGVGISINKVSGTIMGDPMQTKIGIVQFAGRATRRNGNKSVGRVIIPVQSEQYLNGELENDEAYKSALCLLTTLIANDPNLMTIARARLGNGKRSPRIGKQRIDKKDEEIYDKLVNKIIKDKVFFEKISTDIYLRLNRAGAWIEITKEEFEYYKKQKYRLIDICNDKGCNGIVVDARCKKYFEVGYSEYSGVNYVPSNQGTDQEWLAYIIKNNITSRLEWEEDANKPSHFPKSSSVIVKSPIIRAYLKKVFRADWPTCEKWLNEHPEVDSIAAMDNHSNKPKNFYKAISKSPHFEKFKQYLERKNTKISDFQLCEHCKSKGHTNPNTYNKTRPTGWPVVNRCTNLNEYPKTFAYFDSFVISEDAIISEVEKYPVYNIGQFAKWQTKPVDFPQTKKIKGSHPKVCEFILNRPCPFPNRKSPKGFGWNGKDTVKEYLAKIK